MKKIVITIVIAAAVLLAASFGLNGIAARNAQAAHQKSMETLMPGSSSFTVVPYDGEDGNIVSIHKGETGYVIETVTYGYAGNITMDIGVNFDGRVMGMVVRDLEETWSLGAEALTDYEFLCQFLNKDGTFAVGTPGADAFSGATAEAEGEAENTVDAITGATVTTKAIVRCVNSAVGYVTGADVASGATSWGG